MEGGSCQAVLGIATYLTNGGQDNARGEINLFRCLLPSLLCLLLLTSSIQAASDMNGTESKMGVNIGG